MWVRLGVILIWSLFLLPPLSWGAEHPKVVVVGLDEAAVEQIRRGASGVNLVSVDHGEALEEMGDAQALIGSCSPELVKAAPALRWVQTYSAGVRYCLAPNPDLVESEITLTNAKIIQGPEIADHAFALLLGLTRGIKTAVEQMEGGEWNREEFEPIELRGKTALILGLGGIGTQVAERAHAFGMEVLAVDPKDIPFMGAVAEVVKPDRLRELLPSADVVFSCAPHTDRTAGMLSREEIELLPRGAYLINVSRGKIADTPAMLEALRSGRLAGVGLDVTDPEPLPADHPLWSLSNVIITPHIAGQSDRIWERRLELIGENLRRFLEGRPLRNIVDKKRGY